MTTLRAHVDPYELLRLKSSHVMPCVYHFFRNPPHIVAGSGATLIDHEGREYIDCLSGVGVMNAGHNEPAIIEPAIEQLRTLQHTSTIFLTEPQIRLAEALSQIAPSPLRRSFFCASGSEAVEGALLAAQLHTQRPLIVAFADSLHGRTRWAMNATHLPMWRTDLFPSTDVMHVPFGDIAALRQVFGHHQHRIAAVIGEPIQGNGGINVPHDEFWPQVRRECDRNGSLLIFDEVQTGFNRTGRWFATEHWDVAPDLMAISKGLGNGFPIAAFMASETVARTFTRPSASTYGGNPFCAAAALATIDFHRTHDLSHQAANLGESLLARLRATARNHAALFETPRGKGLMCGLPIRAADASRAARLCDELLELLKDRGVLAGKTGRDRNVLTFLPPLVIGHETLMLAADVLDQCADSLASAA